jgi:hypothetical protein
LPYLADDLVASVKLRGSIPTAQITFTSDRFLSICDEETQSYIVPFIQAVREDHYTVEVDVALSQGVTSYRIPYRAVGASLREVVFVNSQNAIVDAARINQDDAYGHSYIRGFKVLGPNVVYIGGGRSLPNKMRLSYYVRPNRLVKATEAARIVSFDAIAKTITLGAIPAAREPLLPEPGTVAPGYFTGVTSFDIVRNQPPFEHVSFDVAGTYAANVLTVSGDFPAVQVGDFVARAEETPVPQVPAELHPLLAQKVAAKCLESLGDTEGMKNALALMERMEADAKVLITPRVLGAPTRIVPRNALWRR